MQIIINNDSTIIIGSYISMYITSNRTGNCIYIYIIGNYISTYVVDVLYFSIYIFGDYISIYYIIKVKYDVSAGGITPSHPL